MFDRLLSLVDLEASCIYIRFELFSLCGLVDLMLSWLRIARFRSSIGNVRGCLFDGLLSFVDWEVSRSCSIRGLPVGGVLSCRGLPVDCPNGGARVSVSFVLIWKVSGVTSRVTRVQSERVPQCYHPHVPSQPCGPARGRKRQPFGNPAAFRRSVQPQGVHMVGREGAPCLCVIVTP